MKKYAIPFSMFAIFEIVAVTLWLTKDNIFYLFNFSYIGISISLAVFLYIRKYKHARRIAQLLVVSLIKSSSGTQEEKMNKKEMELVEIYRNGTEKQKRLLEMYVETLAEKEEKRD